MYGLSKPSELRLIPKPGLLRDIKMNVLHILVLLVLLYICVPLTYQANIYIHFQAVVRQEIALQSMAQYNQPSSGKSIETKHALWQFETLGLRLMYSATGQFVNAY